MPEGGHRIDVAHVAALARLELDPALRERLEREMAGIVGYVDMLNGMDLSGIEPTAHAVPMVNILRDDKAGTPFPRDVMLANAPAKVDELIKVPKVIPGEEGS